ncbi:MAG: OsmC/Ohr family protein [Bacteroidetes bacterium]|nr:OsmC/Ohr family protein [Bacteroidota bacterium]
MTTRRAIVKQLEGIAFVGKSDSNHWVTLDGPMSVGGSDAGSRPKELLLMALGGCTGSDVVSILKKKRVSFDRIEIELEGNVRDEHPQVFTDIHIGYPYRVCRVRRRCEPGGCGSGD